MEIADKSAPNVPTRRNFFIDGIQRPQKASKGKLWIMGFAPGPRWVMAICLMAASILSGPFHFNWSPTRRMLLRMGAYDWTCVSEPTADTPWECRIDDDGTCPAQKTALARVVSLTIAFQFGFSMITGQMSDRLSWKFVSILGFSLSTIGWVVLGLSTQAVQLHLLAGTLIGIGQDMSFFPLMYARELFPNRQGLLISIIGTGRSVSGFVPMLMDILTSYGNARGTFVMGYLLMGLMSILISYFCLPWKGYAPEQIPALTSTLDSRDTEMPEKETVVAGDPAMDDTPRVSQGSRGELRRFFSELARPEFILFLPFAINALLRPTWLAVIAPDVLSQGLRSFELAAALSFILCPFFGYMVDKVGILSVLLTINTSGMLTLIAVLISDRAGYGNAVWAQFLVAIGFAIIQSFILSQVYCYAQIMFQKRDIGKLIGVLCTIGGLSTLMIDPLYAWSLENGFTTITSVWIAMSAGCNVIVGLIALYRRNKRRAPKIIH